MNSLAKDSTIFIDLGSFSQASAATTYNGQITISDGETPLLTLNKSTSLNAITTEPETSLNAITTEPETSTFQNEHTKSEDTYQTITNLISSANFAKGKVNKRKKVKKTITAVNSEKTQKNESYLTNLRKRYKYVFLCQFCDFVCPGVRSKMQRIQLHLIHHPDQYVDEKFVDLSILKKYNIVKDLNLKEDV